MKHTAIVVVMLSLVACKKDKQESAQDTSGTPAAKPTDKPADKGGDKPAAGGPFAAWDMAGRTAAFQGAHVTPGSSLGAWEAWNVQGDKVTIWDGTAEKTLDFKLVSPCEVKITEKSAGGSSSTISHYTIKDGAIWKGLGDAGSRKGPEAIACISNTMFIVDAKGTCMQWEESMFDDGKYEQKPGTCGFRKDGDKEVFAATVNGHETVLEVHGDALLSEQVAQTHSEKVANFAAAKSARDAKK